MKIRRQPSNIHFLPVCRDLEELIEDLLITMKNSSRDYRFLICEDILSTAWELHEKLTRAGRVSPKFRVLGEAVVLLDVLKSKIRVAYEVGGLRKQSKGKIHQQMTKIGASVGGWYSEELAEEQRKKKIKNN